MRYECDIYHHRDLLRRTRCYFDRMKKKFFLDFPLPHPRCHFFRKFFSSNFKILETLSCSEFDADSGYMGLGA